MTSRQAFQENMQFRRADCMPLLVIDPYESLTVDRWHREGVPEGVWPATFLNMDASPGVGVSLYPQPAFEKKRLSENERQYIETDEWGCTVQHLKEAPGMYYGFLDHPVKTSGDWDRYKERLASDSPGRLRPKPDEFVARANAAKVPVGLNLWPWFFRYGFYLMGMERFLTAFYDEPDLIHDLFEHIAQMTIANLKPVLKQARFDWACYSEDLAYRGGPHISPAIYREFWLPHQDPVTRMLRDAGIPIISLYTSGNCEALLPLAMEHGINCTWPCERNAGMDPLALRRKFGRELRLVGGVGHTCLTGGLAAIDAEVQRLVPLVREGGFIPMLDDMIPPEVPFENYRYCIEAIRVCWSTDFRPAHFPDTLGGLDDTKSRGNL